MVAQDPLFWRAGAISTTTVMLIVLAFLTLDSVAKIRPGGANVPTYSVINRNIDYLFNAERGLYAPVIGGEQLLFGKSYSEAEATALVAKGKLVIQSRACMGCHTFFGNGSYYAPDLTKAWLDPVWQQMWMPMTQSVTREEAMVKFLMNPEKYPTWGRRMPNLNIDETEARALVAYLKWMSSVETNGFPTRFDTTTTRK